MIGSDERSLANPPGLAIVAGWLGGSLIGLVLAGWTGSRWLDWFNWDSRLCAHPRRGLCRLLRLGQPPGQNEKRVTAAARGGALGGAPRSSSGSVANQFDFTGEQADHHANRA